MITFYPIEIDNIIYVISDRGQLSNNPDGTTKYIWWRGCTVKQNSQAMKILQSANNYFRPLVKYVITDNNQIETFRIPFDENIVMNLQRIVHSQSIVTKERLSKRIENTCLETIIYNFIENFKSNRKKGLYAFYNNKLVLDLSDLTYMQLEYQPLVIIKSGYPIQHDILGCPEIIKIDTLIEWRKDDD